jgi:hypothetical protein
VPVEPKNGFKTFIQDKLAKIGQDYEPIKAMSFLTGQDMREALHTDLIYELP